MGDNEKLKLLEAISATEELDKSHHLKGFTYTIKKARTRIPLQ